MKSTHEFRMEHFNPEVASSQGLLDVLTTLHNARKYCWDIEMEWHWGDLTPSVILMEAFDRVIRERYQ